jgi:hypothetical protein
MASRVVILDIETDVREARPVYEGLLRSGLFIVQRSRVRQ